MQDTGDTMNSDKGKISMGLVAIIAAACIVLAGAAIYYMEADSNDDGLGVVVTIVPQAKFAEKVGGDMISVTVMVPVGQSPHDYEPTAAQLQEVADAEIYFKVGSGVEFETAHLDELLEVNPHLEVVDCSSNITLLESSGEDTDEAFDPHVWLSPVNAIEMVREMAQGLKAIDPENADFYQANADSYIAELENLDSDISQALGPYEGRSFIVQHDSWGYFAKEYGIVQLAVEPFGNTPTATELASLIDQAEEDNITAIFVSPQFDISSAEVIAESVGAEVIMADPLAENYIENLSSVANDLEEAFQ